jgi:hypothetical protein
LASAGQRGAASGVALFGAVARAARPEVKAAIRQVSAGFSFATARFGDFGKRGAEDTMPAANTARAGVLPALTGL